MDDTTADAGLSAVGMLGNGAPAGQVLEAVAMRKHGDPAWEPFHYEKISDTEYEVSGGTPAVIGGVKKWPGPHSTVLVSVDEIAEEQLARFPVEIAPAPSQSVPVMVSQQNAVEGLATNYLTVVLQLPADAQGRKRICNALSLDTDFFGAKVTATSLADEIAVNQLLELRCDPVDVQDVRTRVARRNQTA
ncbi:hypothetical protein SAMN04515617_10696 [Collimonas sp. OK242]|jgi:hypothetical protein|uniref:hypothetical protein n=1 Tax=Collimonas sp. OK242 TaxID=1798195 RepID=UPI00089891BF|nr:hypothetical protein [Collimonas sp. OK242]SDX72614.1 hypothetical protein SAMN04515617_10696 [Collimonas sp. OK242]